MLTRGVSGLQARAQGNSLLVPRRIDSVPRSVTVADGATQQKSVPACNAAPTPAATIRRSAQRQRRVNVNAVAVQSTPAVKSDGFKRGAHWEVHKFGGTCMAAAERIRAAAELMIKEPAEGKVVVVSAMGSHPSSPLKVTGRSATRIRPWIWPLRPRTGSSLTMERMPATHRCHPEHDQEGSQAGCRVPAGSGSAPGQARGHSQEAAGS